MMNRRQFLVAAALSSFSMPKVLANVRPNAGGSAAAWVDGLRPKSIAIIGDLQRTNTAESILMSRSQNDKEREAIVNAIADERPDMLLLLGDQVSTGEDPDDWAYYDKVMSRVNKAGIPIRAIYGNHDYGRDKGRCIRNFCERFPHQADPAAGLVRLGSIALITLDTNFDQLSSREIDRQAETYKKWLRELEDDQEIRGVLVAAHHPPYTNSELGRNDAVISMFVDPFYRAKKTRLFLSGHVHSYERFAAGDKMFVVSGGGGGPRRTVDVSTSRPFQNDAYRSPTALRPFHWIRLRVSDNALKAETMMLKGKGFTVGDKFEIGLY